MLGEENYSCHLRSQKVNVISVEYLNSYSERDPGELTNDIEQWKHQSQNNRAKWNDYDKIEKTSTIKPRWTQYFDLPLLDIWPNSCRCLYLKLWQDTNVH